MKESQSSELRPEEDRITLINHRTLLTLHPPISSTAEAEQKINCKGMSNLSQGSAVSHQ